MPPESLCVLIMGLLGGLRVKAWYDGHAVKKSFYLTPKPQCYYYLLGRKRSISLGFLGTFMSICSRRTTLARSPN